MKKLALALVVIAALSFGLHETGALRPFNPPAHVQASATSADPTDTLGVAFAQRQSGIQVSGEGVVTKLLADDNEGGRHQRFILALPSGQTLLVAHNIDLAPRLQSLKAGDVVAFDGVYEWNAKGGVIHWTHRDPAGQHRAGWLRHAGRLYQ
jgi:hypothetical protein